MPRTLDLARALFVVSVAVPAVACGDGGGGDDEAAPDARAADARPQPVDAGPAEGGVASNLPGLTWEVKAGSTAGLEIVSSNFVQENLGGSVYQNWYAEVRNNGTRTLCFPEVTIQFQDASGSTLAEMYTFADTAPYKTSSTLSTSCLAPGATGAFWDIQNPPGEAAIGQIRRASYTIGTLEIASAVPHSLAPTITGTVFERLTGYWAVQGTVRGASGGAIRNIGMDVYPVGPEGWIVDNLIDTNLGSIPSGGSWAYETTSYQGSRFTRYHQYVSFIEGSSVAASVDPAIAAAEARRKRWHDARSARSDQRAALR